MSEEHEVERTVSREEAVAAMQAVVDGVASGTLRFDAADVETVDVDVPDHVEFEVELERGEDETELELELEWPAEHPTETERAPEEVSERTASAQPASAMEEREREMPESESTEASPEHGSASSDGQPVESSAEEAVDRGSDGPHAIDAAVIGPAEQRESLARFEVYQDKAEAWRWRLVHHNGNVIADGGEGYTSKQSALKGLRSVMANAPGATVQDQSKR